jgi:anti-sigma B factor antagonist
MRIRTESTGDRHHVALAGRFDAHETANFRVVVEPLVCQAGAAVRLDLTEVVFIDSSALAELVRADKQAKAAGSELMLARLSTAVRVILELTALDLVFLVAAEPKPAAR